MRALVLSIPVLMAMLAVASAQYAPAQYAPASRDTVLSPLPSPALAEGIKASDALRAAQGALAAGRSGEAQEALEMAQTRMLDRSVALGRTNSPSDDPTVRQISEARQALAARDRTTCMQLIQTALGSAIAQGL